MSYSQQNSFSFVWLGDSINGKYFEKTVLIIPIQIDTTDVTYYFQFDTGSNKSFLYKNKIIKNDTINNYVLNTNAGKLELIASPSNYIFTQNGYKIIGTLGADFIKNKIVEIDYVNQKLVFLDNYPPSSYNLRAISLSYGRPVLEVTINNRDFPFLFDTGSSLFDIWTTHKLWEKWRNRSYKYKEFPITSWKKVNIAYQSVFKDSLCYLNKSIQLNELWYNSNKRYYNKLFKQAKVKGIIGNKPFYNSTILIDLKSNYFGVKF